MRLLVGHPAAMVLQRGFQRYNKPGCSLVHRRLAQHSAWMAWSSHRRLTSTSITCRQLTLRRLRRDYQNLMTVQSQAWLTYRSSSRQGSKRSEGSVTAKTSWRLTPMRNARDQLSSPLLPLTSELPSALSVSRSWSNDSCGRYHFGREALGQGGDLR